MCLFLCLEKAVSHSGCLRGVADELVEEIDLLRGERQFWRGFGDGSVEHSDPEDPPAEQAQDREQVPTRNRPSHLGTRAVRQCLQFNTKTPHPISVCLEHAPEAATPAQTQYLWVIERKTGRLRRFHQSAWQRSAGTSLHFAIWRVDPWPESSFRTRPITVYRET